MAEEETFFDKFWEVSSLDRFNTQEFARQLNSYDSDNKELMLEYPRAAYRLPQSRTKLNKLAKNRQSDRLFSGKRLSLKELGRLLSSFYAWNGLEHRGYPSAGATYATEIFGVAFSVEKFTGQIIYYDPENHGATIVKSGAPSWAEAEKNLNMNIDGTPNLLIIFVNFPERATAKYGVRGGRFALLEAGAAMQQLALQIAETNLKGVAVGGMLDEYWKQALGLAHTSARITLGYLVGK